MPEHDSSYSLHTALQVLPGALQRINKFSQALLALHSKRVKPAFSPTETLAPAQEEEPVHCTRGAFERDSNSKLAPAQEFSPSQ